MLENCLARDMAAKLLAVLWGQSNVCSRECTLDVSAVDIKLALECDAQYGILAPHRRKSHPRCVLEMAKGEAPASAPGLSFPRETFAKLTPKPFLHAHLKQPDPVRANGRAPTEARSHTINTGSLTHTNGSAVVRRGDTAVVCGVRAEVLLASDIPHPPDEDAKSSNLAETLGLLVPNVELSTGCSPAHLPGNPPGTLAQSLSHRVMALLYNSNMIDPSALHIQYTEPQTDEDLPDEEPKVVTKAYWTLYIDILCIALDGNAFDTIWTAVLAALRDTVLPAAWWDPDREMVLCSPQAARATRLELGLLPMASTFAVFSTASPLKGRAGSQHWVLVDPDSFEEDTCEEMLAIASTHENGASTLLRLEKTGGTVVGYELIAECLRLAEERFKEWRRALEST